MLIQSFNGKLNDIEHITICICTYRRPECLYRLLSNINLLETKNKFTVSIVIVDNDNKKSAFNIVEEARKKLKFKLFYCVEEERNIAKARNKAIDYSQGDYIAFIDDDEIPKSEWLLTLYDTIKMYKTDGVLGPVIPKFESQPPAWVLKGNIFERPGHSTGDNLDWPNTRTGNVLLKRQIFTTFENRFNNIFSSGGEDRDLFYRLILEGYSFVWCQEAPVYELILPYRYSRLTLLKRALLRGQVSLLNQDNKKLKVIKSIIAIIIYLSFLPLTLLIGQHVFMKYLIKIGDHIGRLLASIGIKLIKEIYISN